MENTVDTPQKQDNALTVLKDTKKAFEEMSELHKDDPSFDKEAAATLIARVTAQIEAAEKRNPIPDDPDAVIPPQEEEAQPEEEEKKPEEKLTALEKIEKGIKEVEGKLKEIITKKVSAQHFAKVMEDHQRNAGKLLSRLKEARRTVMRNGAK